MYVATRSTRSERVRMNVCVRQQNGTGEIGQHFAYAPRAVLEEPNLIHVRGVAVTAQTRNFGMTLDSASSRTQRVKWDKR
jgi:hypothetical protein